MGDISSDTESQLYMLRDTYKSLRNKNPSHELLALAEIHKDEMGFNWSDEYRRRCVRDSDRYNIQGFARYTAALEDAVNNRPFKLLDTKLPCEY